MKKSRILVAVSLVAATFTGWQLNDIASAARTTKKVCMSSSGKISKKTTCASTDTELATGRVRTKSVTRRAMKNGTTKLTPTASASAMGVSEFATSVEQPLVSALGATVRAYTYALTFPSTWDGSISTSCASNEIQTGAYSAAYLNGVRVPSGSASSWFYMMGYVAFNSGGTMEFMRVRVQTTDGGNITISDTSSPPAPGFNAVPIDAGLVIYVVQLCAPLTTLEGVG